ncbi:MAG TPA: amidohydrolase family protein [Burkholderiales bacterium]|nr:amidohydrolase family protein [Burkholderiales bacterium]
MKAHAGSIDAHAHWAPEPYVKYLAELGRPAAGGPLSPLMFDLERRLKWMDERNLGMHVLTLSGAMPWQWASQDQANRIARIVNDAAIEAHKAFPDRFLAGISMPMRDPKAAMRELERVAGEPGICAVHMPNSVEARDYIFEPAYLPIIARCEELGLPLLFHPLDGVENHYGGTERLAGASFMYNTLGFPFETATTAAKFISTGLLDRFPKLEIVLPHSGGCFPYIAGRIEHSVKKGVSDIALERPMREYVRRFHYDTLAYWPETLRFMIEIVGADRVVIGSDNYAKMDVDQPNALAEQIGLRGEDLERVLRRNAERLFRIT